MEDQNENVSKVSGDGVSGADVQVPINKNGSRRSLFKMFLSLGGLLLLIFLVAVVSFWQRQNSVVIPGVNNDGEITLSSKVSISSVGENAFGTLANLTAGSSNSAGNNSNESLTSTSMDKAVAPTAIVGQGGGGVSSGSVGSDMIYPYQPTYTVYVYKGEEFSQNEVKMNVLKRTSGVSDVSATAFASALDFNLFDLGKLNSAKTSNFSFYEDKEFGYRTDIDLVRGGVSIYKNWEKWPNIYAACKEGGVCATPVALRVADLPKDGDIIDATNAFLKEYKVDTSAYGTPKVNKNFFNYYAAGQEVYVPDEISVIYPLVVDGKSVFESYGEVNGLSVNYDLRNKKVSSMYNLMTHNYQSSAYDAVTDVATIVKAAENADGVMPLRDDASTDFKTVEIELDTPFVSYENLWKYEGNQSSEYLVPCLVFPVKSKPDNMSYVRERVIVPIIKDFFDQNNGGLIMMKEGIASTGTAGVNAVSASAGAVDDAVSPTPTKPSSSTVRTK